MSSIFTSLVKIEHCFITIRWLRKNSSDERVKQRRKQDERVRSRTKVQDERVTSCILYFNNAEKFELR